MNGSSGNRPRQRTYTSCTECRRRKQKCNQAKDRPCNHCARRYPPVICTYENQSPPPSHERLVDLQDQQTGQTITHTNASYNPSTQASINSYPPTTTSTTLGQGYSRPNPGYYPSPMTSGYQSYGGSGHFTGASPNNMPYVATPVVPSSPNFYSPSTSGYNNFSNSNPGYYGSGDQTGGTWYSSTGDPGAFIGVDVGDISFLPDPGNNGSHPHTSGG